MNEQTTISTAAQKLLKEVTNYRYFVSYMYQKKDGFGFGMIPLTMTLPIRSMADVYGSVDEIKRCGKIKGNVVIINWILL